jgi:hypothetical protein
VFTPQQEPEVFRGDRSLKVLEGMNLTLTAERVFAWLKVSKY